ncbi:MAG TPA: PAS domain S-box protein [Azonexus sp.]
MDNVETYATFNLLTYAAGAMLVMLGMVIVLGVWVIVVHHRNLIAGHRREIDSLALARRYEILVRQANDCIIISDARHRIIDVNKRCRSLYGYSPEEMRAMTDDQLLAGPAPAATRQAPADGEDGGPLLYEVHHRRKDGSVFPVEISEVVTEIDGERQTHRIVRDITERRASQDHIAQLSLLSIALANVNHAIAHSDSLEEVFASACRACVDNGGFRLAWIGFADRDGGAIRITQRWGEGEELLDDLPLDIGPEPADVRGPSAIAFREQRPVICADLNVHPDWREQAERLGIAAAVALPITCNGRPVGVLTAYGKHPNAFGRDAECLLGEIANSLSFAMHHFAEHAVQRETEQALRQREEQLLRAEEIARLGHWEVDLDNQRFTWSPQIYKLFERDPALGPASAEEIYTRYFTADSTRVTKQGIRQAIATGSRVYVEQELRLPGERTAYHATVIVPIRDASGRTVTLHGTVQDVTAHKLSEARLAKMASRLAQSAREYEDLYQNAPCGYHSLDKDGVFQRVNQTELHWLGYSRDEVIGKMKIFDLLPPAAVPGVRKAFGSLVKDGELRDLEQNLICKDGSLLPVLLNASAIRSENGQFLMSRSTAYNMTERKKTEAEREQYLQRLTQLSRRLVSMQEEERRRLSASLHDRTSPNLAAIGLNLSVIGMPGGPALTPELAERLEDIRALLDDTSASIREISTDLRPPLLDYAGLVPTLESYLHQFAKRTGTTTHLNSEQFVRPAADLETLLFRIAQEALTNIAKHAGATAVDVALANRGERVVLSIRDDGNGFDPETLGKNGKKVGLGMLNMREMTEFAGGRFAIESSATQGTLIQVEI